jgi:hypothetical protein
MRQRAVLIRLADDQPLEPFWNPLIEPVELERSNQRLLAIASPFRWRWLYAICPSPHAPCS